MGGYSLPYFIRKGKELKKKKGVSGTIRKKITGSDCKVPHASVFVKVAHRNRLRFFGKIEGGDK